MKPGPYWMAVDCSGSCGSSPDCRQNKNTQIQTYQKMAGKKTIINAKGVLVYFDVQYVEGH